MLLKRPIIGVCNHPWKAVTDIYIYIWCPIPHPIGPSTLGVNHSSWLDENYFHVKNNVKQCKRGDSGNDPRLMYNSLT